MAQQAVFTDIFTVNAGANLDLVPPAGFDMEVSLIGSSVFAGIVPNQRPDVNVGLFNGLIGPSHILRSADVRGWMRRQAIQITPATYLRFTNPGLAAANISYSAKLIRLFGSGNSITHHGLVTVAAGGTVLVRPPADEEWIASDFSSDQWLGVAPGGLPNLTITLTNGTIAATILMPTNERMWNAPMKLYVNNTWYLEITNSAAVPAVVGYCAQTLAHPGNIVRSQVQTFAAGLGNLDFRPAIGEEWHAEVIGGSAAWVGVPPAARPDLTAHIFDGTIASQIMISTNVLQQQNDQEFYLDRDHYIRLTDTSGAVQNAAVNAVLTGIHAR